MVGGWAFDERGAELEGRSLTCPVRAVIHRNGILREVKGVALLTEDQGWKVSRKNLKEVIVIELCLKSKPDPIVGTF